MRVLDNRERYREIWTGHLSKTQSLRYFMNSGRIESQAAQEALLVWQEGLPPHLLRNRPVHCVMHLVRRHPSSPHRARHWTGAVGGPEATVLHVLVLLRQQWVLPQWVFARCSPLRCAPEQQKVSDSPFSRTFRRRRWELCIVFVLWDTLLASKCDVRHPQRRQRPRYFPWSGRRRCRWRRRRNFPFSSAVVVLGLASSVSAGPFNRCRERIRVLPVSRREYTSRGSRRFRRRNRTPETLIQIVVVAELQPGRRPERANLAAVEELVGRERSSLQVATKIKCKLLITVIFIPRAAVHRISLHLRKPRLLLPVERNDAGSGGGGGGIPAGKSKFIELTVKSRDPRGTGGGGEEVAETLRTRRSADERRRASAVEVKVHGGRRNHHFHLHDRRGKLDCWSYEGLRTQSPYRLRKEDARKGRGRGEIDQRAAFYLISCCPTLLLLFHFIIIKNNRNCHTPKFQINQPPCHVKQACLRNEISFTFLNETLTFF